MMNGWMNELERIKEKEIEFLNNRIERLTKERNMYRSQSIMRMNKIKELEGILNGNGEGN